MSSANTCPICGGTGKKLRSFYPDLGDSTDNALYVTCRGCSGSGIIFVPTSHPTPWPRREPREWRWPYK